MVETKFGNIEVKNRGERGKEEYLIEIVIKIPEEFIKSLNEYFKDIGKFETYSTGLSAIMYSIGISKTLEINKLNHLNIVNLGEFHCGDKGLTSHILIKSKNDPEISEIESTIQNIEKYHAFIEMIKLFRNEFMEV